MRRLALCLVLLFASLPASAAEPPARVLLLGTWHFANPGLDLHNTRSIDVLEAAAQEQIATLVERLARFAPDRVFVEWPAELTDQRYAAWLADELPPSRNEVVQLGFRLARLQGHARVHGIDVRVAEGDSFPLGTRVARVLETPGHTVGHICYVFDADRAAFVGDTLFSLGCGRLFEGTPAQMWASLQKLMALPDDTRVYVGHDYPNGRDLRFQTTIGESKRNNVDLPAGISEDAFVRRIEARDRTLSAPRLLFPSLQANINAGALPAAEGNGVSYLKIPLNYL